jgi:thiamine pyrophosphokinase
MGRIAFVFCGGGPVRSPVPVVDGALVVAADVGVVEAERLGLSVDLLIGDLDSAPPHAAARVEASGGRVDRHPADKDASDLELAVEAARRAGATEVLVVGGDGGRLDHLLANALLLAAPRFADVRIDAILGDASLHVIRERRELEGRSGELITLLPVGGPARGVRTTGLRYSLLDEELRPGSSRGLSNAFSAPRAEVVVLEGVLLAIRPGEGSA